MVVHQLKAHLLVQLELNIKLRPTLSAPSGAIMNYSVVFTINTHHCTTERMDLLSKVKPIDLFPMLWVDESADIDEVRILNKP